MKSPGVAPLKSAVIGAGKISEEHLRFLRESAGQTEMCRPVGVCDLSPVMARFAGSRFHCPAFTDHAQMLAQARPDVVHILTPPESHAKLIADCLAAGAHVICEKPLAVNHAEFTRLWELSQQCGRRLIEDHNCRFNEPVLAIERWVKAGRLGEVREVEVRLSLAIDSPNGRYADENLPHSSHALPGGVIHEFLPHLCYLALRFCPGMEQVCARWRKMGSHPLFKYDDLDATITGPKTTARLRFTSRAKPDGFSLIVRGTRGWAETDIYFPFLRLNIVRPGGPFAPLVNQWSNGCALINSAVTGLKNKIMNKTPLEGMQTFLHRTYTALRTGAEPPVSFADMDQTARLIDELVKQA
jgi:predicted dehydrogenase